jgi:hypothetical protein
MDLLGNICVGGPSCTPSTACTSGAAQYCGVIGDGCGRGVDCGACTGIDLCVGGVCVPPDCQPLTCENGGVQLCGTVGDGCGATIECGDCTGGTVCGAGNVPNVCPTPNCTPTGADCTGSSGAVYCGGTVGDGCNGAIDCSAACPGGVACGTEVQNVCDGTGGGGGCTGLACVVEEDNCPATSLTTLTGVVYDPAGDTPLYNAMVYVPNAPLDPIPDGVSCEQCGAELSGAPIATALSTIDGSFTLSGVPWVITGKEPMCAVRSLELCL